MGNLLTALTTRISGVSMLQLFQLVRFGSLFLLSIVLVKSGKSKEAIAQYENLFWTVGVASFFWVNALSQLLLARYGTWREEDKARELFRFFALFQIGGLVSAVVVFAITQNYLIAAYLFFHPTTIINENLLYLKHRNKELFAYSILIFVTLFLLVGFGVILQLPIENILHLLILGAIIRWSYMLSLSARFSKSTSLLPIGDIALALGYLAFGFILSGSAEYINGWLVKVFFDDSAFAEFRIGTKELPIFTILTATLSNSFISKIVANPKVAIAELKWTSLKYMHFLFPTAIVLAMLTPTLFPLVFSKDFNSSSQLFLITLLLTIPRLIFPQTLMHAHGFQREIMIVSGIELILNVALAYLFLHLVGLKGIVIGLVLANLLEKIIHIAVLRYKTGILPTQYIPLNWFLGYSFCLATVILVFFYL